MKLFAGNIFTKESCQKPDLDLDIIQTGENSFFIMGAEESCNTKKDLLILLEKSFWEIVSDDLSFEWEQEIEVLSPEYEQGVYERVLFSGPEISFETILERFAENTELITVRESWEPSPYGNKSIIVDFIY